MAMEKLTVDRGRAAPKGALHGQRRVIVLSTSR
jgi:hypothetical protein